jgi:hypothetical protein
MTGELFPVVDRECLTQLLRDAAKRSLFRCVESSTCAVFHLRGDEISALVFDTVTYPPPEWYHMLSGNLIAVNGRENSLWCRWSVDQ